MKTALLLLITILFIRFSNTNSKPAYSIYDNKGKAIDYEKAIKPIKKSDMIFFRESYNNPISY